MLILHDYTPGRRFLHRRRPRCLHSNTPAPAPASGKELHDVPVVAVSGCAAPEGEAGALAAGCDGYITGQINLGELYRTLVRLLPEHLGGAGPRVHV